MSEASITGSCLDDAFVARFVGGDAEPAERLSALAHADECEACRELLARLLSPSADIDVDSPTLPHHRALAPPVVEVGEHIEHYEVVGVLGRGAYGVVVRAWDSDLAREVALKLLRPTRDNDNRRLMREAQAMAKLSHPNVVRVHGVGVTERGVHVAMEMVDGTTLTGWLEQGDRSWEAIVDAWVEAGRGLAAAHAAGLVHRDFKPDNVLVRSDGAVLVTDFGLAAAPGHRDAGSDPGGLVDLSLTLTQTGAIVGTPRFMAPEQMRAEPVDARADQFAFGVSLYRALYGEYPFAGGGMEQLVDSVCSGEIRVPPDDRGAPTAMWPILRRCMQRDPDDRYPTINAVLHALARVRGVAGRRTRRRLMTALAIGGIAAGVVVSGQLQSPPCDRVTAEFETLWTAERREALRKALASVELPVAETTADHVDATLDQYATRWVALRNEVCTAAQVDRTAPEALVQRQLACLDSRRRSFGAAVDVLSAQTVDEKAVHAAVALVSELRTVAACQSATSLASEPPPLPDPASAAEATRIDDDIAHVRALARLESAGPALALAHRTVERARALGHDPLTVRALNALGEAQVLAGDSPSATATVGEAYLLSDGAADGDIADNHVLRGQLLLDDDRYDDALVEFRKARAIYEKLRDVPPSVIDNVGIALRQLARYDEAHAAFDEALALRRLLLGPDNPALALSYMRIANVHIDRGEFGQSIASNEQALAIAVSGLGDTHPQIGHILTNIANAQGSLGRLSEALTNAQEAQSLLAATYGPDDVNLASAYTLEGTTLYGLGRFEEALAIHDRTLKIVLNAYGHEHPETGAVFLNRGSALLQIGKTEESLAASREATAIWTATLGADHPRVSLARSNIASALLALGEYGEALQEARSALEVAHVANRPGHFDMAGTLSLIGSAAFAMGDCQGAYESLTEAQQIQERALGLSHPDLAITRDKLGFVLQLAGHYEQALDEHRAALEMRRAAVGDNHPMVAATRATIAMAMARAGDRPAARRELARGRDAVDAAAAALVAPMLEIAAAVIGTTTSPPPADVQDAIAPARSRLRADEIIEWQFVVDAWVAGPRAAACPLDGG